MSARHERTLVIGAGIAGIRAALDLAETGNPVTLIDREPHVGGILARLDYQFPSNHCGMCRMLPSVDRDAATQQCLRRGLFHRNIDLRLSTTLTAVAGEAGRFEATLETAPAFIDPDLCIGCGQCAEVCPVSIPDPFNQGMSDRKAAYRPTPHLPPNAFRIDPEACTRCGQCVPACPVGAIDLDRAGAADPEPLVVGAIVLAGGTGFYDPGEEAAFYFHGSHPGVVTSLEMERLLNFAGPTDGKLVRPGDGRPVESIAWIQCVGSRNTRRDADFCSSICCMYAMKEAWLARERSGGSVETVIFHMDLRAFGQDHERYRRAAAAEAGVRFERTRIHSLEPLEDGRLRLVYISREGERREEDFDLVVLSVGQRPSAACNGTADLLGLERNPWGFPATGPLALAETNQPGVFLAGTASGQRDITESVILAGNASLAASLLVDGGPDPEPEVEPAPETRDLTREPTRILVALCACRDGEAAAASLEALRSSLAGEPDVDQAVVIDRACADAGWRQLLDAVGDIRPNRILVGGCLPLACGSKLRDLAAGAGLPEWLVEGVEITGLSPEPAGRLDQTGSQLGMALTRLRWADPTPPALMPVTSRALVVGGGPAGMTAALAIADRGYETVLVERNAALGGNLSWIHRTLEGHDLTPVRDGLVQRVNQHPRVRVLTRARVVAAAGRVGRFFTTIDVEDKPTETIEHGVVVIATGAREAEPAGFGWGQNERVITQKAMEDGLDSGAIKPSALSSVMFIQCAGSRGEPRMYCSRVCCPTALKQAVRLKEQNPDMIVSVLARDVMTPGFAESEYTRARRVGVIFIPYDPASPPRVETDGDGLRVVALDSILGRDVENRPDLVVLAAGMTPAATPELAAAYGADLDSDGFLKEADVKWRPVDTSAEGVFACGTAMGPRNVPESLATAGAAAQRALRILSRRSLPTGRVVSRVRDRFCSRCRICVDVCPYQARSYEIELDRILINPAACQGCGVCAAACPNSAAVVAGYPDQSAFEIIDFALQGGVMP